VKHGSLTFYPEENKLVKSYIRLTVSVLQC